MSVDPDLVLWHEQENMVHFAQLTAPHEENMQEAHQMDLDRYKELAGECEERGWFTFQWRKGTVDLLM